MSTGLTTKLIGLVLLNLVAFTQAATITVSNGDDGPAPGPAGSLRRAINDAAPGDTIIFAAGLTAVTLTSGELLIDKNLTIAGPGANILSVQRSAAPGTPDFRIFNVDAVTAALAGITIQGATAGGIFNRGTLTVMDATIAENFTSGTGGGILNTASLSVINTTLSGNSASVAGGGIATSNVATSVITNSTISGNHAGTAGGGVVNDNGTTNLTDCTVANNSAGTAGGGVFGGSSAAVRSKNTIIGMNTANVGPNIYGPLSSQGWNAIGAVDGSSTITASNGDQIGVTPAQLNLGPLQENGGRTKTHALLDGSNAIDRGNSSALGDQRGRTRPVDSPILANAALGNGSDVGAYEVQPDVLAGCSGIYEVQNNEDSGAGSLRDVIASACGGSTITFAPAVTGMISLTTGELAITKGLIIQGPGARVLTISGNNASRIFNVAAGVAAKIENLTMANGNSIGFGSGGAVFNSGTLTLMNCAVQENSGGSGGGAANSGTLTVTSCTFARNQSTGNGGALRNTGIMSVVNSTLHDNTAVSSGAIASFNNGPAPTLTVTNCTITGNRGTDPNASGGGILNGGTATVSNTIVAHNTAANGPDVFGAFTSGGHNLIRIGAGSTSFVDEAKGDRVGTVAAPKEPSLDLLKNNGGPTDTLALFVASIARDGGDDALAPPADQRGYTRAGPSDIGAFELGGTPPPTPTPTPNTTLANISTRLRVQTGDNVLIGGFIITGTQQKRVIIRGIGPSLPLAGRLDNPMLELRDGAGALLDSNDDWVNSPNKQAIIDTTIPPSNDLESAIVAMLPANGAGYTAIVRGVNDGTGIGVVEAYDLDRSVDSELANISTRGFVSTGDNVLIAGTIVLGQATQKVIIRAIGPSLPITGKIENPTLELRDANGALLEGNDDWVDSPNRKAIEETTIPPSNALESAIVRTLAPASYTAIVRGVNESTGIAVVEVYALP